MLNIRFVQILGYILYVPGTGTLSSSSSLSTLLRMLGAGVLGTSWIPSTSWEVATPSVGLKSWGRALSDVKLEICDVNGDIQGLNVSRAHTYAVEAKRDRGQ